VNAGSSSLKLSVVDGDGADAGAGVAGATRELGRPAEDATRAGLARFIGEVGAVDASAHRVVHGGPTFTSPVVVDGVSRRLLGDLAELAPLHNPPALDALDTVQMLLGADVPAVACFDTAFHARLPAAAATFALPAAWSAAWGLRRYGFHGLSHHWATEHGARLLGRPVDELRLVSCHLGSGSSLAAVDRGRSVDTTMGFTPADGLVMATRPGAVDPGMLAWLVSTGRLSPTELSEGLEHASGLKGMAGVADIREVMTRAAAGDEAARLALDVHHHRLRGAIAAMVAALGGIDALVWTGGIGEHAPEVRAAAVEGLRWLDVSLDPEANARARGGDAVISPSDARVGVAVVSAREDLVLAAGARAALPA